MSVPKPSFLSLPIEVQSEIFNLIEIEELKQIFTIKQFRPCLTHTFRIITTSHESKLQYFNNLNFIPRLVLRDLAKSDVNVSIKYLIEVESIEELPKHQIINTYLHRASCYVFWKYPKFTKKRETLRLFYDSHVQNSPKTTFILHDGPTSFYVKYEGAELNPARFLIQNTITSLKIDNQIFKYPVSNFRQTGYVEELTLINLSPEVIKNFNYKKVKHLTLTSHKSFLWLNEGRANEEQYPGIGPAIDVKATKWTDLKSINLFNVGVIENLEIPSCTRLEISLQKHPGSERACYIHNIKGDKVKRLIINVGSDGCPPEIDIDLPNVLRFSFHYECSHFIGPHTKGRINLPNLRFFEAGEAPEVMNLFGMSMLKNLVYLNFRGFRGHDDNKILERFRFDNLKGFAFEGYGIPFIAAPNLERLRVNDKETTGSYVSKLTVAYPKLQVLNLTVNKKNDFWGRGFEDLKILKFYSQDVQAKTRKFFSEDLFDMELPNLLSLELGLFNSPSNDINIKVTSRKESLSKLRLMKINIGQPKQKQERFIELIPLTYDIENFPKLFELQIMGKYHTINIARCPNLTILQAPTPNDSPSINADSLPHLQLLNLFLRSHSAYFLAENIPDLSASVFRFTNSLTGRVLISYKMKEPITNRGGVDEVGDEEFGSQIVNCEFEAECDWRDAIFYNLYNPHFDMHDFSEELDVSFDFYDPPPTYQIFKPLDDLEQIFDASTEYFSLRAVEKTADWTPWKSTYGSDSPQRELETSANLEAELLCDNFNGLKTMSAHYGINIEDDDEDDEGGNNILNLPETPRERLRRMTERIMANRRRPNAEQLKQVECMTSQLAIDYEEIDFDLLDNKTIIKVLEVEKGLNALKLCLLVLNGLESNGDQGF